MPHATAAFDALAGARHSDPFSILGPHLEPGGLVVRAFQPSAERIEVMHPGGSTLMSRVHDSGVFEARLPGQREIVDYRLRVTYPDGQVLAVDDPYRYGRVISEYDVYLFSQGKHTRIYDKLGAHLMRLGNAEGVHFGVWAPNAERVSVVGDFNAWDGRVHPMRRLNPGGVWEIFVPGLSAGERYKFEIRSTQHGELLLKADPYGFLFEKPPLSASVVARREHSWGDAQWLIDRAGFHAWFDRPMAIYEVHLGSWARVPEERNRSLTYTELPRTPFPLPEMKRRKQLGARMVVRMRYKMILSETYSTTATFEVAIGLVPLPLQSIAKFEFPVNVTVSLISCMQVFGESKPPA